jgi:hypothetical protein
VRAAVTLRLRAVLLTAVMSQLSVAAGQTSTGADARCSADICLQSGMSNWRYDATEYCEADVCLRARLETLTTLDWERLTSGSERLAVLRDGALAGLPAAELERVRRGAAGDIAELVSLLGNAHAACERVDLTLRLDVPGYDLVDVSFAIRPGEDGFGVTRIDRTFRSLPGGSVGWWVRWISHRFPGIALLDGEPMAFASYEIGLYMGRLVLYDRDFEAGPPDAGRREAVCSGPDRASEP